MKTFTCDICNKVIEDSKVDRIAFHAHTQAEELFLLPYRNGRLDICDDCYSRILYLFFTDKGRTIIKNVEPSRKFKRFKLKKLLEKAENEEKLTQNELIALRELIDKILPTLPIPAEDVNNENKSA